MFVVVDVVNTSVKNVGSAAKSPACCANTSAPTQMSGRTTVSTVTSPSRLKVRAKGNQDCSNLKSHYSSYILYKIKYMKIVKYFGKYSQIRVLIIVGISLNLILG